jgi:hypothetical protein
MGWSRNSQYATAKNAIPGTQTESSQALVQTRGMAPRSYPLSRFFAMGGRGAIYLPFPPEVVVEREVNGLKAGGPEQSEDLMPLAPQRPITVTWWEFQELAKRLQGLLSRQLELDLWGTDGAEGNTLRRREDRPAADLGGPDLHQDGRWCPSGGLSSAVGPPATLGAPPAPSKAPQHDESAQARRRRQDEAEADRYYRELIEPYPTVEDPLYVLLYGPNGVFPRGRARGGRGRL